MSLAILRTKSRTFTSTTHDSTALEAVERRPQTREEQLSGGRARMRHLMLALMAAGSAVYGLVMALTFT